MTKIPSLTQGSELAHLKESCGRDPHLRSATRRRTVAARGRSVIAWSAAGLFTIQLGLALAIEYGNPALRDPEYGRKLALLRARLAEDSSRPLVLAVGSSRTQLGLRPQAFPADVTRRPLVFNFGICGAGPVRELVLLRGLLAEGIRPEWLLIEIHPLLLHEEQSFGELDALEYGRFAWSDLSCLSRYVYEPWRAYVDWLKARLTSGYVYRGRFLNCFLPSWLESGSPLRAWAPLDTGGWLDTGCPVGDPDDVRRRLESAVIEYAPAFAHFRVTERPNRAVRELLDLCRRQRIAVACYLMPESRGFQEAYSAETNTQVAAFLCELAAEYQVVVCDATDWIADSGFIDGHHLRPEGADDFSNRFGQTMMARARRGNETR